MGSPSDDRTSSSPHRFAAPLGCLQALRPGLISTAPGDCERVAFDAWPAIAKWSDEERARRLPIAVATPDSTEEVSAVLRVAHDQRLPVVPVGARSGVVGGVVCKRPALALDLSRLSGVLAYSDEDFVVTAAAGTPAIELERYLNDRGRTLGHYPQSLPLASVGGLVATRSSGTFSSRYGNIEDLVVALQVVLADGSVVETKATPRAAVGPRLLDMFVGSEGTLGVITAVTLRVRAVAAHRLMRGLLFPGLSESLRFAHTVFATGQRPAILRIYDPAETRHFAESAGLEAADEQLAGSAHLAVVGVEGPAELATVEEQLLLRAAQEQGAADLGAGPGEAWLAHRFDATWLARGNEGETRMADAIEVSAPWSRLTEVYERVTHALHSRTDRVMAHLSHFYGDGGSVYFIFFVSGASREAVLAAYDAAWSAALTEVLAAGGSIAHHHGIGKVRAPWLAEELGTSAKLLTAVKRALDPHGLLAPGNLALPRAG